MHPNTACIRPMSSNHPLGRVSKGPVLSYWLSILNLLHVHIIFTCFIFNTSNGGFLKAIPTKQDQNWRLRSCHIHCSLRTKAGPAATWQNNIQSIESPFYKRSKSQPNVSYMSTWRFQIPNLSLNCLCGLATSSKMVESTRRWFASSGVRPRLTIART